MKAVAGLLVLAILLQACSGPSSRGGKADEHFAAMAHPADLAVLEGDDWTGELTYLNQGEPKREYTVPAELAVAQNDRTFELYFTYPDEPEANGRAEVTLSADGRRLNDETIIDRKEQHDGLMLVTEQACRDEGLKAECQFTYWISVHEFSIRKNVTLAGADEAIPRNVYEFAR